MHVYIGGDSYCYARGPSTWPYVFADRLNATLEGIGFAGRGFWRTRLHLMEYLDKGYDADLFVFCHTEPSRMLSSTYAGGIHKAFDLNSQIPPNNREIIKIYNTYLYDQDVHDWAMSQWFLELNEILKQKPVIHFFIEHPTKQLSEQLNGYKLESSLFTHTRNSNVGSLDPLVENYPKVVNHFTTDYNIKFGNALADYCLNEVLPNPMQTKYFDLDII